MARSALSLPVGLLLGGLLLLDVPSRPFAAEKAAAKPTRTVRYNRDVRPILAENCFACHGPDSAARKADLRLDRREDALAAEVLVPGDPTKSETLARILLPDHDDGHMPPASSHKKLTAAQKATIRQWIAEGAEYEPHWSFISPTRPKVPVVREPGFAIRNPIDAFLAQKLHANGLRMAPEADRRTLARRVAFDLTGLPPEPADVEAFVHDHSENAYDAYIDKMLASPHWGEHRGRYWLDAARYADTHGIHFDNYREMWSYRDWVIDAFNANTPFDQFTLEQLAGDLLPRPTLEQRVATGFTRCNITTNEGGAIAEEYLVLYARDRTETMAQVWLGLTAGCAVCHDHKFDPISQKEFYALAAFFNNTPQAAMDGNVPNTPPVIPVPHRDDRARWDALQAKLTAGRAAVQTYRKTARGAFETWAKTAKPDDITDRVPANDLEFHAKLEEGRGPSITVIENQTPRTVKLTDGYTWTAGPRGPKALAIRDGNKPVTFAEAGNFDRPQPFTVAAWLQLGRRETGTIVGRMDNTQRERGWDLYAESDRLSFHLIHSWPTNALKVTMKPPVKLRAWNHVAVTYDGSGKAAGVTFYLNGQPQPVEVVNDTLNRSPLTNVPLALGQRHTTSRVKGVALQDLRLYRRALTPGEAHQVALAPTATDVLAKPAPKRTPADRDLLFNGWLTTFDADYQALAAKLSALEAEEVALRSRGTIAHIAVEGSGEPKAYVLHRGEYDQRREEVKAGTPEALPGMPGTFPRNRLGLAHWLLRPDHPLTARVTVNRFWQEVFGTGLVRTAGDFGITGETPSHPELLDWLAVEFRESGWDVKKFFKLMLTSAAYRQSATTTPQKREKDPFNTLLSRGPRFRMDAEMIRDTALAASGLLVRKLGGPSVKPYQPEGVWEAVAMIGSNTRNYTADTGDKLYRRGLYTFWKRSAPPASLEVMNAPNREVCAVRRERTNTPMQALATLNDIPFVEAARVLAEKSLHAGTTAEARLQFMAKRLLSRPLRAEELRVLTPIVTALEAHYHEHPAEAKKLIAVGESKANAAFDAATLAAYTMAANQLMNLDEVLCK